MSRWVTWPGGPACVHASVEYTEVRCARSDKFPTNDVVRGVQAAAGEGGPILDTALGVSSLDFEGLYLVEHDGHRVIWVSGGAASMKKRSMGCAHLEWTGHCGVDATMARLERHRVWERVKILPHFTVGNYVLVARVSRQGKHRKLITTWIGPWRVADDDKEHVYAAQHLVTAELRDDKLEITRELLKIYQQLKNQGEYHIRSISAIKRAVSGSLSRWPPRDCVVRVP